MRHRLHGSGRSRGRGGTPPRVGRGSEEEGTREAVGRRGACVRLLERVMARWVWVDGRCGAKRVVGATSLRTCGTCRVRDRQFMMDVLRGARLEFLGRFRG